MKIPKFSNDPAESERYRVMFVCALRRRRYRRVLWQRLRAAMAECRRGQAGAGDRYERLLKRALRHEQRARRAEAAWFEWMFSRDGGHRPEEAQAADLANSETVGVSAMSNTPCPACKLKDRTVAALQRRGEPR